MQRPLIEGVVYEIAPDMVQVDCDHTLFIHIRNCRWFGSSIRYMCSLRPNRNDGSCTFRNGHLHEICINMLVILWNRYAELCAEQDLWKERAVQLLMKHTEADEAVICEFEDEHWQNLLPNEDNIMAFHRQTVPVLKFVEENEDIEKSLIA